MERRGDYSGETLQGSLSLEVGVEGGHWEEGKIKKRGKRDSLHSFTSRGRVVKSKNRGDAVQVLRLFCTEHTPMPRCL